MVSFPYMKICLQTNMLHTHTVLMCILSKIPIAVLRKYIFWTKSGIQKSWVLERFKQHASSTRNTIKRWHLLRTIPRFLWKRKSKCTKTYSEWTWMNTFLYFCLFDNWKKTKQVNYVISYIMVINLIRSHPSPKKNTNQQIQAFPWYAYIIIGVSHDSEQRKSAWPITRSLIRYPLPRRYGE